LRLNKGNIYAFEMLEYGTKFSLVKIIIIMRMLHMSKYLIGLGMNFNLIDIYRGKLVV